VISWIRSFGRAQLTLFASALAAPALAATSGGAATITRAAQDGHLPGGDSVEMRALLTDWSRPPEPRPRLVDEIVDRSNAPTPSKLQISSGYGWRTDPLRGGHRRHEGVDLPGRLGSEVRATGAGIVTFAGWARGYGNLVQIDHPGGFRTRYGHLSKILVSPETSVSKGEVVGRMGSTGRSTGSHLHYEVRFDGHPTNPLAFMGTSSSIAAVSDYAVEWPRVRDVAPRWTGWSEGDDSKLPEAQIR
jgi:murein DD-endopeptidase MepM/ murein hydrolase activator NlpD